MAPLAKYRERQQRMLTYLRLGCVVVLLVIFTGCSTDQMRTIDPVRPIVMDENTGMIVGSITGLTYEHCWAVGAVPYGKVGGAVSGWLESGSKMTNAFWIEHSMTPGMPGPDPGLEDVIGRVFAVTLPAGSYALFPSGVNNKDPLITIEPAQFEVKAGEIKYIGRIQLQACLFTPRVPRIHRGFINASIPSIKDMWEQDKITLHRKYPELTRFGIVISPIDDKQWHGLIDVVESKMETNCRPE